MIDGKLSSNSPEPTTHIKSPIWHFAQVREGVIIGQNCVVSKGAYIDIKVVIGDNVKIQNGAQIFAPARISDGVFIGPCAILTNDKSPRAVNELGQLKSESDWEKTGVTIQEGASVGAGAICIAPVTIGEWSMVGAGSVVTHNTVPYGLYTGVPASRVAWVGKAGVVLIQINEKRYRCPITGTLYQENSGLLSEDNR